MNRKQRHAFHIASADEATPQERQQAIYIHRNVVRLFLLSMLIGVSACCAALIGWLR